MTATDDRPAKLAFSPREVAEMLGIGYEPTLALIHSGELFARKRGQRYVVPKAAIDAYLRTPADSS